MKHTVTKSFTFDMGHRLSNYEGKCKHLHGHTYKLEVTIECDELDDRGMVMDFGDLKKIYKEQIEAKFDHKLLLYENDDYNQRLAKAIEPDRESIVWAEYNPTAENIVDNILGIFQWHLPNERRLRVSHIRLYETPTSYADIIPEGESKNE